MIRIFYLIFFLLVVIFGIIFAVLNAEPVQLNYYFGEKSVPLSLTLVLAMIVGAGLGVLASASLIFNSRREITRLKKTVELTEKEVSNLRAIPTRDEH